MKTLVKFVFYSSSLLILHVFSWTIQALESPNFHIVDTDAYLSTSNVCDSTFTRGSKNKRASTFKIVDRFGPRFSTKTRSNLSLRDIISLDQSRVDSIHKLGRRSNLDSAESYGYISPPEFYNASNYVVTIALGTPVQQVAFLFSTGANYTLAQCAPLYTASIYDETSSFNSSASTTFSYIACDAPQCNEIAPDRKRNSSADNITSCNSDVTDDGHYFPVSFSKDKLVISDKVISDFVFGCTGRIPKMNGMISGILGLSRNKYSFISQVDQVFSYCLPPNETQFGYLRFGEDDSDNNLTITDLADCPPGYPWAYCIDITAITVGEVKLPIDPSVFETSGAMIDSDAAFTYLPPEAYSQLRTEFMQQMANYTEAPSNSTFDTCYITSSIDKVPVVSFTIGDVPVNMEPSGILVPINDTISCLAFMGFSNPESIAIFGSRQQQGLKVMFDVSRGKIGFGRGDCFQPGG